MERIRVEIEWDASDGAFDDLTNEGDDASLVAWAALHVERGDATVIAYREEI
jgi:hypothetical protein